jgi:signal transduction histidine kinase
MVYRIIQECISNVIKHADATKLDISLIQENDFLHGTIEDNGIGFDSEKGTPVSGLGFENIRTRILFLKGELDISSQPGKGTLIAFHIPIKRIEL